MVQDTKKVCRGTMEPAENKAGFAECKGLHFANYLII